MFCCSSHSRGCAKKKNGGNPDQPWIVQQKKVRKQDVLARKQQQEMLLQEKILCTNEFADKTSSKIMFNEIQQLVNHAKSAQADDLDKKRERLSKFLAFEEESYEKEFQIKSSLKVDTDVKARETRLMALRNERTRSKELFVEQKRMQQMLERCDTIRPILRQKIIDETKHSQWQQIEDNKLIKMAEKDMEAAWSQVAQNVYNQRIQREKEEDSLSQRRYECCAQKLRQQMAEHEENNKRERIQLRSNEPMFKPTKEYSPEEEELALLEKRNQLVQNSLDLKEQQRQQKLLSDELAAEDQRLEEIIMATVRSEIVRAEERLRTNKRTMHIEAIQYLDYLKKVEKERKLSEMEMEKLVFECNRKINESSEGKRCELIKQQQLFAQSVHAERWKQITDRKQQRQDEHNKRFREAVVERETAAMNAKIDREATRKKYLDSIIYGKELLLQAEELNAERKKQLQKEHKLLQKIREEDLVSEKFAEIYLSGEQNALPVLHPFTRIIQKSTK